MKNLHMLTAATALSVCFFVQAVHSSPPPAEARLGINLNGISDWSTELPFVDVFKTSRKWISQRQGEEWGKGPEVEYDSRGWVARIEEGCWIETPLCTIGGGHYPSGEYTILYNGDGDIDAGGAAKVLSREQGRIKIEVDPAKGPIWLSIRRTNPDNYVRDIRVIMPGFLETYESNPWHPVFLGRWKGMACLRFMDFMHTNNSTISTWDDRPVPGDASYSVKGVPLELMIDLANRKKVDPWFCIPHLADDDYVRKFAEMTRERLVPGLKVYVEFSNELWNSQFSQTKKVWDLGKEKEFAEKPWEAGWRYNAYRSVQIFKIWEEVFGRAERLVRVLASQSANPYISERIVEFQEAYKNADALAIAPYISCNVRPDGKPSVKEVEAWSLDDAFEYLEKKALPDAIESMVKSKAVADKFGLRLIAYEGGQHMVGVGGGENSKTIEELFHKANRDKRMGDIYTRYYDAWKNAGGDLFCHFSSIGKWSKWGAWGLMEYYDEDPQASPKFRASVEWAKKQGQRIGP